MGNVAEISFRDETQGREGWHPSKGPRQTTDECLPKASGEYLWLVNADRCGGKAEALGQTAAEGYLKPGRLSRVMDNIFYPRSLAMQKKMEKPFVRRRLVLAAAVTLLLASSFVACELIGVNDIECSEKTENVVVGPNRTVRSVADEIDGAENISTDELVFKIEELNPNLGATALDDTVMIKVPVSC